MSVRAARAATSVLVDVRTAMSIALRTGPAGIYPHCNEPVALRDLNS